MTYLVTGGGGFIGSHLVDYLLTNTSSDILILDNFSTGYKSNISHPDSERIDIYEADIRNESEVAKIVSKASAIYHLAAVVGVRRVVERPLETLQTNLHGTENVLKSAAQSGIPVFIASSSEVYGKSEAVPFSETDDRVLGPSEVPRWGYAAGKATDEFLALTYQDKYNFPVVVGRYFNIVGPRQSSRYGMVIPRFVEQALAGDPLTVYSDGNQTRSFTHVRDAVKITHELLRTADAYGEVINIGAPDPTSVNELAERVIELADSDSDVAHIPLEEVYGSDFEEPEKREPDVTKLTNIAGWAPETNLERILRDVIGERRRKEMCADD
jgi:UDP-glucose 4-epimerase